MRPFRISPETQQRLAVIVPLLALAISLFLVYPGWGRYRELQSKIERQRRELGDLKAAAPPPPGPVRPTVPDQASEPSEFLGLVTQLSSAANCSLQGLDVASGEKQLEGSIVRPLRARIAVEGRYPDVRQFLSLISRAPRLLVVTDMALAATAASARPGSTQTLPSGLVRATVEVERYVASAAPAAPGS